jgi:phage tail-like protein
VGIGITVTASLPSLDVSVGIDETVGGGFSIVSGQPAQLGVRQDPFLNFNFAVEIEGMVHAGFSEVSGLQVETEVQEYREGGVNEFIHKRAGPTRYPSNLVLKKGITVVHELWDWYWQVTQGIIERRNLSVLLMDTTGQEQRRWNFEQAYPVKWVGPDLRASANEVAVESLEFAHKGLAKA